MEAEHEARTEGRVDDPFGYALTKLLIESGYVLGSRNVDVALWEMVKRIGISRDELKRWMDYGLANARFQDVIRFAQLGGLDVSMLTSDDQLYRRRRVLI